MGYVIVDHRAAPPAVQRQYGRVVEYDTAACKHCGAVIKIVRRQRQGEWCLRCGGPVCLRCYHVAQRRHETFQQKIDAQVQRNEQWRKLTRGII